MVSLSNQVSANIQGIWAKKEKARRAFVLTITLGKLDPKRALADLGAFKRLMSMYIAKQLPFKLKPSRKPSNSLTVV